MTEQTLQDIHYLEVLKEAALYNQKVAYNNLQDAKTEFDRVYECQEMETWKGVLVMLRHRETLVENIKLLMRESTTSVKVLNKVKEDLKDIGVFL